MHQDDPLAAWLLHDETESALKPTGKKTLDAAAKAFEQLEALVRDGDGKATAPHAKDKKRSFDVSGLPGGERLVRLPEALRKRAEALYPALWNAQGKGKQRAEESLLSLIGYTADPESVPFFVATLGLSRTGDTFAKERRRLALAGLAHVAIRHKSEPALESLHAAARHDDSDIRAEAVLLLGRTVVDEGGPLDTRSAELILKIAESDPHFEPRFLARGYAVAAGVELPAPDPAALLTLEVSYAGASRTLELRATDTLDSLAHAILDAYGFDHEHLYAFYMNGKIDDPRFELSPFEDSDDLDDMEDLDIEELQNLLAGGAVPNLDQPDGAPEAAAEAEADADEGEDEEDDEDEDDEEAADREGSNGEEELYEDEEIEDIALGLLGLPLGHRFLFRYDFGDDHRFEIKVVDLDARAEPDGEYPRVAAKKGRAPQQYRS